MPRHVVLAIIGPDHEVPTPLGGSDSLGSCRSVCEAAVAAGLFHGLTMHVGLQKLAICHSGSILSMTIQCHLAICSPNIDISVPEPQTIKSPLSKYRSLRSMRPNKYSRGL